MGAIVGQPYRERSALRAGEVLQQRFKILRFIARGGAGEVYEAFDLELSCPVALKIVRPEVAQDEVAIDRFRREIALARQVTHPNVSRIFDVFRHELPSPQPGRPATQTLFLTMELLVGESLSQRIQRSGPMSPDEALAIIVDMVEGLKAAHRVGIIHRDFKSANVMLARQGDEVRAVITDFGLARSEGAERSEMTHTGIVVGTPYYMAPEQLTGGEVTPAADIYALGVVIYEMLTGKRPFTGSNEVSTAIKRLTQAPPSPRLFARNLPENWEHAILRCLEVDVQKRIRDLDELVGLLAGGPRAHPVSKAEGVQAVPAPTRTLVRRSFVQRWLPGLLVMTLVAWYTGHRLASQPAVLSRAAAAADADEPTLFLFTEMTPLNDRDPSWIGFALAERTAAEFARYPEVEVRMLDPQETLGPEASGPRRSPLSLSNRYGGTLISGAYSLDEASNRIRASYSISDDLGTRVRNLQMSFDREDEAIATLTRQIQRELGLDPAASPLPLELETAAARALRDENLPAARWLLERRLALGESPVSRAHLGRTVWRLGEAEEARRHLRTAIGRSQQLERHDQLVVEAIQSEMDGDLESAERTWSALFRFFPDNKDYGVELVRLQIETGRAERARSDLARIAQLAPMIDARVELLAARLSGLTDSPERHRESAAAALELASRSGSDGLLGQALLEAARAAAAAGEPEQADELAERAAAAFQRLGNRAAAEQARALTRLLG